MKRSTKIVLGMLAFGVTLALAIGGASGSAHLGLHGSFWISLVFGLWLEAHVPE